MARQAGQNLLHYRLIEKIGQGGMGSVWRARDTTLDRDAAIKILPDALANDPQLLARFEREAKLLASLNHPNVAAVFGVHEADSTHFLAMELVPGEDLSQRLKRGALPVEEVIRIMGQISEALEAAHEKGVIHRDLKPANVRLTPDGRVKVLDFGLAKSVESDDANDSGTGDPLTATGVVLGTAPYMSPEQIRGRRVDARTDVWSFGCVVWECLTGKKPFRGDTVPDQITAILNDEPDWGKLPAGTPPSVTRLLRRCLAKVPRERLHHVADARIELEDAGAEPDGVAREPARRPLAVPFLAGTLVLALGALLVMLLQGDGAPPSTAGVLADARFTKLTNYTGEELAAVISPDGRDVAFVANRRGPFEVYAGPIGGRYQNVSKAHGGLLLVGIKEPVSHLGFLGDGEGLWLSGGAHQLSVRRVPLPVGPMTRFLVEGVLHVDWSPNGKQIVYSMAQGGDPVFVADPDGANEKLVLSSHDGFH